MTTLATLTLLGLLLQAQDVHAELKKADRDFDREKWAAAAEGYAKVTAADPSQGGAWFNLGYSWHKLGEYEKSCAAAQRASEFPEYRPTALYNLACAHSLLDHAEEGATALEAALDAGFLDYDTMAVDADIALLRDAGKVSFAPRRDYVDFKFRNGVECGYEVIVPEGHDATEPCRAVVCFPPGRGRQRSADWFTHEVLGADAQEAGWIVVVLIAPERGWQNHPAHHALEGLLKEVRNAHEIDGKFQVVGLRRWARSAATYARMSRKFFEGLTTVSSRAWAQWDDPGRSFRDGMPVHLISGGEDAPALAQARAVEKDVEAEQGNCRLTILPDENRRVPSLRGAAFFAALAQTAAMPIER